MKSALLSGIPGLIHGFGSRAALVPPELAARWESTKARWKQVHGAAVREITAASQDCGEVDGMYSFSPELPVAVTHADCTPILLARRDGKAVAAVHAGWRGTRARILQALWVELRARGECPSEWVAAVGPAIGPCCYEVSEDLASDFAQEFDPEFGNALAVPRARHLDLPGINGEELRRLGLAQVEVLRACTRCSVNANGEPLFHSYRREGVAIRQYSAIARQ